MKPPITIEDFIRNIGEIPYCGCGCENKINVKISRENYNRCKRKGYPKYINGHCSKTEEFKKKQAVSFTGENNPMYGTHRCGKDNPFYNPYVHKTIEEMIIEFGEIPFCGCGCKQKVNVNPKYYTEYKNNGGFPKYLPGHHMLGRKRPEQSKFMMGRLPYPKSCYAHGDYHLTPNQGVVWMSLHGK